VPRLRSSVVATFAITITLCVAACGGQAKPASHRTAVSPPTIRTRTASTPTTSTPEAAATTTPSRQIDCHRFTASVKGTSEAVVISSTPGLSCVAAYQVMHDFVKGIGTTHVNGDANSSYTKVGTGWRCDSQQGTAACWRGKTTINATVAFSGAGYSSSTTSTATQTTTSPQVNCDADGQYDEKFQGTQVGQSCEYTIGEPFYSTNDAQTIISPPGTYLVGVQSPPTGNYEKVAVWSNGTRTVIAVGAG
jgi:hypothetical protein